MAKSLPPGYTYVPGSARRVLTPSGDTISRRQAENIGARARGHADIEAQRAAAKSSGISDNVQKIHDTWRRNAEKQGLDPRIRENAKYQNFKRELQDLDSSRADLLKTMGKKNGQAEYQKQRLDIYLKHGLITKGDYDRYKRA